MTYKLEFLRSAQKEWRKLGPTIRKQFRNNHRQRLVNPKISSSKLSGAANRFKIKLRSSGFRLIYEVQDKKLVVTVIAVGKRDRGSVYDAAVRRISKGQ